MELARDLKSRQEVRELVTLAVLAQEKLSQMDQSQLDAIVSAMAKAGEAHAAELAQLAVEETGFGNVEDKIEKNRFAAGKVWEAIRDQKTVGILHEDLQRKIWDVGVPVGLIAAIVPSTNPTSTVIYKALIALKSGNAIVFSPHPKAICCTLRAAQIMAQAAEAAGCPKGAIGCMTISNMDGVHELMHQGAVKLILATGGPGLVKAAYSSGKPAIGVGAGNGPAYLHPTCDLEQAARHIIRSKTFDNGVVCASEQSIICHKSHAKEVEAELARQGCVFLTRDESECLAGFLFRESGAMNPGLVGKTAPEIACLAGFRRDMTHAKILIAREFGVGKQFAYSMEKLCPVLGFYEVENEEGALKLACDILRHEGSGHTFAIHCQDEAVVRKFAMAVPVSRFLVNTPSAQGGVGLTTGLFPALTLGCGAAGGSSSSNNIGPLDLINIRRVAFGNKMVPEAHTKAEESIDQEQLVELLAQKLLERINHKEHTR